MEQCCCASFYEQSLAQLRQACHIGDPFIRVRQVTNEIPDAPEDSSVQCMKAYPQNTTDRRYRFRLRIQLRQAAAEAHHNEDIKPELPGTDHSSSESTITNEITNTGGLPKREKKRKTRKVERKKRLDKVPL